MCFLFSSLFFSSGCLLFELRIPFRRVFAPILDDLVEFFHSSLLVLVRLRILSNPTLVHFVLISGWRQSIKVTIVKSGTVSILKPVSLRPPVHMLIVLKLKTLLFRSSAKNQKGENGYHRQDSEERDFLPELGVLCNNFYENKGSV